MHVYFMYLFMVNFVFPCTNWGRVDHFCMETNKKQTKHHGCMHAYVYDTIIIMYVSFAWLLRILIASMSTVF